MCEICRHHPCDPRCPNAEIEHEYIGHCEECKSILYLDEEVWTDNDDNLFCDEYCATKFHGIKEVD